MLHVRICAGGAGQPTSLPRHLSGFPTYQELTQKSDMPFDVRERDCQICIGSLLKGKEYRIRMRWDRT
jgi:hypothetical protein